MKVYNRIFSALLAVTLLLTSFVIVSVSAASTDSPETVIQNTYTQTVYNTPEEKLETMTKVNGVGDEWGYTLYYDAVSGEVATVDNATGQILFTNPYDVATSGGTLATRKQILSQIIIQYLDNGDTRYLYSFEEAAMRQQINILNIKNGVRVEYTIGREETRKLVPRWISEESFKTYIQAPMDESLNAEELDSFSHEKFFEYYTFQCYAEKKSKKAKKALLDSYPICAEMNIYTFAPDASASELNWCESYIKAYCEDYTFEQMEADHEETGYVATDEQYPVFKLALEYTLGENGLTVRLPCNGLRYDMSVYTLEYISVLPYMGAGNTLAAIESDWNNYNVLPDGSGALFDFEQLNTRSVTTIRNKIYGTDYAYHQLSGTYQKDFRFPVYGTVASEKLYTYTYSYEDAKTGKTITETETVSATVKSIDAIHAELEKLEATLIGEIKEESYQRGYVATIEAGESLAELATYHAGTLSKYNTVINYFNPKPKDSYDISDSISVSGSASWTVVSERKYTGSITIRYQFLTSEEDGKAAQEEDPSYRYYDASYVGMAEAYRDFLIKTGKLQKLTDAELEENIPLYLEVFGAVETQQTIATIPVNVMTPLTTFENVLQMYNELSASGVKNINFKMTGFANGGMYYTVPSSLKWENKVGGSNGFKELVAAAEQINASGNGHIGLFPDFDFAYAQTNTLFDSLNLKDDAIKTIDNRYSSKRTYSATYQDYVSFFQLAISPSRYSKFYNKLIDKYSEYGLKTMSVGSIGTALNSDFDEDAPYNREDNKEYTIEAFRDLQNAGYSLMTDGGNAYTWGYVDHIINVDLDSSRYIKASASIPFIGIVLHGYVQFAGTPLNEEGDTDYAMLKAIENGSGLYFILSYQNTQELKEFIDLSQYYSVRYDIWVEDVVSYYNELNSLLKDVQNKVIVNHSFLPGTRILDIDELEADIAEQLKQAADEEAAKQEANATEKIITVADAWKIAGSASKTIQSLIDEMKEINEKDMKDNSSLLSEQIEQLGGTVNTALQALLIAEGNVEKEDAAEALTALTAQISSIKNLATDILKAHATLLKLQEKAEEIVAVAEGAEAVISSAENLSDEVKANMISKLDAYVAAAKDLMDEVEAEVVKNQDMVDLNPDDESTMINSAVAALSVVTADGKNYPEFVGTALNSVCARYFFTREDIINDGKLSDDDLSDDGETEKDTVTEKYLVDNNQIVVVTYGDRNEETYEKTEYKTFILNYNNFAVRVEYEGVEYTIPSGGYVVLYD